MNDPIPTLLPGDHLLYGKKPRDIFGLITSWKTWSPAVHIEVYIGNNVSMASRNGIGVNRYPLRTEQLIAVLRPKTPINMVKGLAWFDQAGVKGRPYGWLDLLHFEGFKIKSGGWICSQFAALFDEACDFLSFNSQYFEGSIDPGDFFLSPVFNWEWVEEKALIFLRT